MISDAEKIFLDIQWWQNIFFQEDLFFFQLYENKENENLYLTVYIEFHDSGNAIRYNPEFDTKFHMTAKSKVSVRI